MMHHCSPVYENNNISNLPSEKLFMKSSSTHNDVSSPIGVGVCGSFRRFFPGILSIVLLLSFLNARSQDTLSLKLPQADSLFLSKNLSLLSQQYNIDANEALIIQAKSYPNPIFTADVNMVDPENEKIFHTDKTGQKAFALEQLIILGGKRKVGIEIAKQNTILAQSEFADLLRNLQRELRTTFFNLYQQRSVLEKYNRQLQLLDTLISSYDIQAKRGNVPMKDVIRLKSVYLKINNDKAELASLHIEELKKIQILLQTPDYIMPVIDDAYFDQLSILKEYDELLDLAMANRPDLKIAEEQNDLSILNVKLQKKLAIPDVVATTSYDQRGGAFQNQINAGISIPLPLWNRNRGNLKAAEFYQKSSVAFQEQTRMHVETDVQGAWYNLIRSLNEYTKIKNIYTDDFDEVFQGVNTNFKKRNINILEFVDFFEAYNESLAEFARVKTQLAIATGQINYVTGSKIY